VFSKLCDNLITAFLYRPITVQKVIQIMLANKRKEIDSLDDTDDTNPSSAPRYNNTQ
jgi:hypothetical protein